MTRTVRLTAAVMLLLAAVGWLFVNGPIEGPVLWEISPDHGVTVADLGSVAAVLLAALLLLGGRRRRGAGPA